jgi:DNA-binding NtrC family response regulator
MDGFALADGRHPRQPGIKVVITSGFPQTRYVDEMRQRAFPLLSKPYRKGDLAQLIRAVLDGRDGKPGRVGPRDHAGANARAGRDSGCRMLASRWAAPSTSKPGQNK